VVNRTICTRNGVDPDRFLHRAIDRYDGDVLHNDWSLEQLVGKLKQLGVLDNTLIVVVSDHGEEFWEHGWTTHGHSLYEELTNGVCLMWSPKLLPSPRRVSEPVQLIDVMPTVLDLLGLKIPDVVQGQSLVPFAKGQPFQRRGPVMTSRFAHPEAKRTGSVIPESRIDTVALIDANWKLVYREQAKEVGIKKVELYDRRTDRREAKDVAAEHPQEAGRMTAEIGKWVDAQKQIRSFLGHGAKAAMDEETVKRLRSLGYLGGKQ
jgi:arylsulfatase A-like enzyme